MRKIFLTSAAALMAMSGVAMAQPTADQAAASNQVANANRSAVMSTNGAPVSSNGGIQYGVGLLETQPTGQPGIEVPHVFGTEGGTRG